MLAVDWFEQLELNDLPINVICNHIAFTINTPDITNKISESFAPVFEDGLCLCTRTPTLLHLPLNSKPVFRTKWLFRMQHLHTLTLNSKDPEELVVILP